MQTGKEIGWREPGEAQQGRGDNRHTALAKVDMMKPPPSGGQPAIAAMGGTHQGKAFTSRENFVTAPPMEVWIPRESA
jgi:hypothetical protein